MEDIDGGLLEENEATQIFYATYKPKEKLGAWVWIEIVSVFLFKGSL